MRLMYSVLHGADEHIYTMLSEATPGTSVRIPLMQADIFTYKYGPFYSSATYSCPVLVWAAARQQGKGPTMEL